MKISKNKIRKIIREQIASILQEATLKDISLQQAERLLDRNPIDDVYVKDNYVEILLVPESAGIVTINFSNPDFVVDGMSVDKREFMREFNIAKRQTGAMRDLEVNFMSDLLEIYAGGSLFEIYGVFNNASHG